jgi:hypothetical protein
MDKIKKWIPSFFLLPLCIYLCLHRGEYTLIDNADLVIHEAGHLFFFIFGHFIYTAGGTLMQMLLPSLIIWYFFRNSYRFGTQVSLLWLGQNLINISVYAADAQAQKLPLLGGDHVYHDWAYMLGALNMLPYDAYVSDFFFGLAIIVFILLVIVCPLIFVE